MLPTFDQAGNLPPGIHWATWQEFSERFGMTLHRRMLLAGLRDALLALRRAGCRTVYVDGSFVTAKDRPGDYDGCWDPKGVALERLDPVFLDFSNKRAAQKAKYKGELFTSGSPADPAGKTFLDLFQHDQEGNPKGIVAFALQRLSL
jgi:hypothetical protein